MSAWADRKWLSRPEELPPPPSSVTEMYEVHLAMQTHALARDSLGGHCGYKIGAVGAEGEPCLYAPLFGEFIVEERGRSGSRPLSSSSIQLHQVEPEFVVAMAEDLPARSDGQPHSSAEVWSKIDHIALSIECCGQRATPSAIEATTRLGKFQDALSAGGVVLGKRLHAKYTDGGALSECPTSLAVNGEIVAEGSGAACPEGGPVGALGWLANHLNARGLMLRKGQVVATGMTCIRRDLSVGDVVVAGFGTLGKVEMVVEP